MDNIDCILIIKLKNNIIGVYDNIDFALDYIYSLINSKIININEHIIIEKIKINTCIILEELTIDLKYIITKKNKINYNTLVSGVTTKDTTLSIVDTPDTRINNEIYENDSVTNTSCDDLTRHESDKDVVESDEETSSDEKDRRKQMAKKFISEQNKLGQEKIFITHELNLLKEQKKIIEEEENIYKSDLELFYKFKNLKNKDSRFVIPFMFNQKYITFQKLDESNSLSFENFKDTYIPEQIKTSYDNLFVTNQRSNSLIMGGLEERSGSYSPSLQSASGLRLPTKLNSSLDNLETYSNDNEEILFDDIDNDELLLVTNYSHIPSGPGIP